MPRATTQPKAPRVALSPERILGQCVLYLHGSLNCEPEAREILAAQIADAAAKETLRTQRTPVAEK